jgi:hypothetical protein
MKASYPTEFAEYQLLRLSCVEVFCRSSAVAQSTQQRSALLAVPSGNNIRRTFIMVLCATLCAVIISEACAAVLNYWPTVIYSHFGQWPRTNVR